MFAHFYLVYYMGHLALFVDEVGDTMRAFVGAAIHGFFAPNAVLVHDFLLSISKQGEGKVVFGDEFLVGFLAVGAYAQDDNALVGKDLVVVAEVAGLLGTTWRIILGIKIQRDLLAFEIGKRDGFARMILDAEIWSRSANGYEIQFFGHKFMLLDSTMPTARPSIRNMKHLAGHIVCIVVSHHLQNMLSAAFVPDFVADGAAFAVKLEKLPIAVDRAKDFLAVDA